jgi:predicted nucleic acid-binding protein
MSVLVDTSIWIDHFRVGDERLRALLLDDQVVLAGPILGELIAGNLPKRTRTIADLRLLPCLESPSDTEVFAHIESHRLGGKGLSWVDCQLLATAAMHGVKLWTRDKRLRAMSRALGLDDPAE